MMHRLLLLGVSLILLGCESNNWAPVVESTWQPHNAQGNYIVQPGDTLYAVAFRHDQDYRRLAAINHLYPPYALRVGQVLRLRPAQVRSLPKQRFTETKPIQTPKPRRSLPQRPTRPIAPKPVGTPPVKRQGSWVWPANGRVTANFSPQQGKKGIDIAGKKGELIRAASNGVVAYSGSGLSGYGNLIIIKHNNQFLTAYGNNLKNKVKEGQQVKAGQVIAEMGMIGRRYWGVHFEIRQSGRPVNPLNYLRH